MMTKKKKKSALKKNRNEIIWNIINSALAGTLVFLGALTSGKIDKVTIITAIVAAFTVFVTKFQSYWSKEENEYTCNMFKFL